jgi:hypothetical protein
MPFDEHSWKFPNDHLVGDTLYLCTRKEGILGRRRVFGARLDCKELMLPDINYGYEKEQPASPQVYLNLKFSQYDQAALRGKRFDRASLDIDESEESVYLFGAHNPVDTLWIAFRQAGDGLIAEVCVRFNFDHEGRIGGVFEHTLTAHVAIEDR